MPNEKRLSVLAILPAIIPSTQILIIKPLLSLHQQRRIDLIIKLEGEIGIADFAGIDIVVFSRNISLVCIQWLDYLNQNKIPIIYDIDDNFFDIPTNYSDFARIVRLPQHQFVITRFIQQASLVRVYSLEMEKKLQTFSTRISLVAGPVDWSNISPTKKRNSQKIRILYSTSRIDNDLLSAVFEPALFEIAKVYKDKIRIYYWGGQTNLDYKTSNIHFLHYMADYDKYLRKLSSKGFDIGLAPLLNDSFHRSKSNIKYREYAASHIAGVYSNVVVYSNDVKNQFNGLLVNNTQEDWFNGISELITNSQLRSEIKHNAFEHVKGIYSQTNFENEWFKQLQEITNIYASRTINEYKFDSKIPIFNVDPSYKNDIHKYLSIIKGKNASEIMQYIKSYFTKRIQRLIINYKIWKYK